MELDEMTRKRVIRNELRRNFRILAATFAGIAVFYVVSTLYGQSTEPFLYSAVLVLAGELVAFIWHFYRQVRKTEQLERLNHADYGDWSGFPGAETSSEEIYQEMLAKLTKEMNTVVSEREISQQETDDYYTTWVHQVKTPIAVMHMLLGNEDSNLTRALGTELFRIEQYVEMALNYTRLGSSSNDLVIQEYKLDDLIRQSIRKYASQFIARKLILNYEGTEATVITDKKWFSSILDQLLSNAIKYTPKGSVTITVTKELAVEIRDTGIGIDPADLPRIFEKGYTGINGRKEHKSTGLGLYLCKKAADKLGVSLRVESIPGEGTAFLLGPLQH